VTVTCDDDSLLAGDDPRDDDDDDINDKDPRGDGVMFAILPGRAAALVKLECDKAML